MNKLFFLLLLVSPFSFAQEENPLPQEGTIYEDTPVIEEEPLEGVPVPGTSPAQAPITEIPQDPSDTIVQDVVPEPDESVAPEVVQLPEAPQAPVVAPIDRGSLPTLSMDLGFNEDTHNPRESHWVTTFGFEGLKYETPFEFSGARKNFRPGDKELWGGRIGIGGEIYLGKGFNTTTKLEGYYVGTLFARRLNAGPEDDSVEFAFSKQTGQVYGADLSQSIGYLFDMKTKNPFMEEWTFLTVEPFIEAGVGVASAYHRINYEYDTGPAPTAARETYRNRVTDQLLNTRFGAGVNLTSSSGFLFYLKAHVNNFNITKRKQEGFSQPSGQGTTNFDITEKDVSIDPIVTYALGGGYKF